MKSMLLMGAALNYCWKGNLLLLFEAEIVELPSPKIQYPSYACINLDNSLNARSNSKLSILVNIIKGMKVYSQTKPKMLF